MSCSEKEQCSRSWFEFSASKDQELILEEYFSKKNVLGREVRWPTMVRDMLSLSKRHPNVRINIDRYSLTDMKDCARTVFLNGYIVSVTRGVVI